MAEFFLWGVGKTGPHLAQARLEFPILLRLQACTWLRNLIFNKPHSNGAKVRLTLKVPGTLLYWF